MCWRHWNLNIFFGKEVDKIVSKFALPLSGVMSFSFALILLQWMELECAFAHILEEIPSTNVMYE